jgi:hypothetical protein
MNVRAQMKERDTKVEVAQNIDIMVDHLIDLDIIIERNLVDPEVRIRDIVTSITLIIIVAVGDIEVVDQEVVIEEEDMMIERDHIQEITNTSKVLVDMDTSNSRLKEEVECRDKHLKKEEL